MGIHFSLQPQEGSCGGGLGLRLCIVVLSSAELKVAIVRHSAVCAPEKLVQKTLDRSKCQMNSVRIDQNMTKENEK